MKTDLLINGTALNLLTCARAYQVQAVWGYRQQSPEAEFGTHFHDFAKDIALGKKISLMDIKGGENTQLLQLCAFYQAMNPFKVSKIVNTLCGDPCIEYQFLVPYKETTKYRIFLCGTIDHIDIVDNCVRIIDHKTARGVKTKDVLRDYESHIQIPWYLWILKKFEYIKLYQEARDWISVDNLFGQYHGVFISFQPPKFELGNRILLSEDMERDIEALLHLAIQKAIYIHELGQTLAPPEGMAGKICKHCFLNNLCITKKHDNLITYLRSQTPEPYDPRTWH